MAKHSSSWIIFYIFTLYSMNGFQNIFYIQKNVIPLNTIIQRNNPSYKLYDKQKPIDTDNYERNEEEHSTIDDELINIDFIGENELDLQMIAVKKMLEDDIKDDELTPLEIFNNMYKDLKARKTNNGTTVPLSSDEMLKRMYKDAQKPDPFDDVSLLIFINQSLTIIFE